MTRTKHPSTDHPPPRRTRASRRQPTRSIIPEDASDPIQLSDCDRAVPQVQMHGFDDQQIKPLPDTDDDDEDDEDDEVVPNQPPNTRRSSLRSSSLTRRTRPKLKATSSSDDQPIPLPPPSKPPRRKTARSAKSKPNPAKPIHHPLEDVSPKKPSRKQPVRKAHSALSMDDQLKILLSAAETNEQVEEILEAWKTSEGRNRLIAMTSSLQSDSDEDEPPVVRSTSRRNRALKRKVSHPEVDSLCGDDDEKRAIAESIADNVHAVEGVSTRRSKSLSLKKKPPSVPLPKKPHLLQKRLNNRTSLLGKLKFNTSAKGSKNAQLISSADEEQGNEPPSSRRRGTRSSARLRRNKVQISDDDASDKDSSSDVQIEVIEEEEIEAGDGEEADDEEAAEQDDDSEDVFEGAGSWVRRQRRKRNLRRKRTRPSDLFQVSEVELSAREQRERLDFLVKQSADIAHQLHIAMADVAGENEKKPDHSAAADEASKTENKSDVSVQEAETGKKLDSSPDPGQAVPKPNEGVVDLTENASAPAKPGTEPKPTKPSLQKEEVFAPPNGADRELQPHQTEGVKWLLTLDAQGLNAILADEMGLGKTIQAVAFLASLVLSGSRGPHLVIAPKNVCEHWKAEIEAWYPGQIKAVTHIGQGAQRMESLDEVLREDNFDILVTSYEVALRDLFTKTRYDVISPMYEYNALLKKFRKIEFEYLVVDEAHRLKNDQSKLGLGIRKYEGAQRRLLLTGTPLSNNLKELWSLMNILNPRIFSSKAVFEQWFSAPFEGRGGSGLTNAEQAVIVDRLHTIIRPFFRRRVRADVCPSFSSADEVVITCPMGALQKALSLHFQRRARQQDMGLLNILMSMRAVGNHPFICSSALYDHNALTSPKFISSSGKFLFLYHCLPRLLAGGHRVLIFTQFHRVLDFLEDLMDFLKIKFGRLDGQTDSSFRMSQVTEFNREGSDIPVFLLSTRAGGVGINLQTADTVILFDSDWNPCADLQAVSRIQRIGQKRTVHIMRLVSEGSVDEIILDTARHKLRTEAVAVGAGRFSTSHGAAIEQGKRQKELEYVLEQLDVRSAALERATEACANSVNSSPESVSPGRHERTQLAKLLSDWSPKLLRVGETSLPDVKQEDIYLDAAGANDELHLPVWLRKDADIHAAVKALKSNDVGSALYAYNECIEERTRVGSFSRKERANRARRFQQIDFFSDMDSGSDDWNVPNTSGNQDDVDGSSADFTDNDWEMDSSTNTGKKKKVANEGKQSGHASTHLGAPTVMQTQVAPVPSVANQSTSDSSSEFRELAPSVGAPWPSQPVPGAPIAPKSSRAKEKITKPRKTKKSRISTLLEATPKKQVASGQQAIQQNLSIAPQANVANSAQAGHSVGGTDVIDLTFSDNGDAKVAANEVRKYPTTVFASRRKNAAARKPAAVIAPMAASFSVPRDRPVAQGMHNVKRAKKAESQANMATPVYPHRNMRSRSFAAPVVPFTAFVPDASSSERSNTPLEESGEGVAGTESERQASNATDKKADDFPSLVRYLQQVTQVADIDFLVDALLECDGNIDAAADYIYSNIQ